MPSFPAVAAKASGPEPFDGRDTRKVRPFLLKLTSLFQLSPQAYADDQRCILFASTFLEGGALGWYEHLVARTPDCEALQSWEAFASALQRDFGESNPAFNAQQRLSRLRMYDNGRALTFNADFRADAPVTGLDDRALILLYWNGLPVRLQEEVERRGMPDSLNELMALATELDRKYWERQTRSRGQGQSGRSNMGSGGTTASSQPSTNTTTVPPPTSNGKDGTPGGARPKLTPEEQRIRRHRQANNLCFKCGSDQHLNRQCPLTTTTSGKAATATVAPTAPTTTSTAPAPRPPTPAPSASIVEVPSPTPASSLNT